MHLKHLGFLILQNDTPCDYSPYNIPKLVWEARLINVFEYLLVGVLPIIWFTRASHYVIGMKFSETKTAEMLIQLFDHFCVTELGSKEEEKSSS